MENISGYARVLARTRVEQQVSKPFLGKPYLKYGQCYVIWSYFFQLGGILGAKHSTNLDAFGHAFLGATGEPGAVKEFFTSVAERQVTNSVSDSMTFADYVGAEFIGRVGYTGEARSFFNEHVMEKVRPSTAKELAWQYSEQGSAVGAIYPHIIRRMFAHTHAQVPTERWELARAAGLNIPPEQDLTTYEEVEEDENEVFMAYCRECSPDLYSILSK